MYTVSQSAPLHGQLILPGDKSISHRAVMLGSIAEGTTEISGLLLGDDVKRTIEALRACGVRIDVKGDITIIEGVGLNGLQAPQTDIYCGNSGTSIRLLTGLFAAQRFTVRLTGDESLSARPMSRVVEPLRRMGVKIELSERGTPPVKIIAGRRPKPIQWNMLVASAQVKSAILLAGLYAKGKTTVIEAQPTRNHTELLLRQFSGDVRSVEEKVSIINTPLSGAKIRVPVDFSSAAFFIVAALLVPGSDLTLKNVGINQTRTGLLVALKDMGANFEFTKLDFGGGELVANIRVRSSEQLTGIDIPQRIVPLMIDEIPILAIAAASAKGRTVLSGCQELRVKESDRIRSIVTGLGQIGVKVEERKDGFVIEGGSITGGTVESFGDHRIAMAFAVAGLVAKQGVVVKNTSCVGTSFPNFAEMAQASGMNLREVGND